MGTPGLKVIGAPEIEPGSWWTLGRDAYGLKLYLPPDISAHLENSLGTSSPRQSFFAGSKLDFKNNCLAAGNAGVPGGGGSSAATASNLGLSPSSPDSQQFNIFPAIFSRQLNFSTGACGQGKLMDDLRPNLVGGLLGLQQGLLEDHALAHGNLQHGGQESKFMALQDNRLMGISSHENRLLGLTQDTRSASAASAGDNKAPVQRKCSSTPEDFNALYGGLPASGLAEAPSHHHTPTHTPPTRLSDHTVTGNNC
uniref:Uncharacterized protein n=1 Tax=Phlebotomus papatasi TaxID=29031 RepID=A0A1B0DG44_PHLPP